MRLLSHLLRRFVRNGHLLVTDHAGRTHSFGTAGSTPEVAIRLTDKSVEREIFFNPELKTAEAYMDTRLVMQGDARCSTCLSVLVNRSDWRPIPPSRSCAGYGGPCVAASSGIR